MSVKGQFLLFISFIALLGLNLSLSDAVDSKKTKESLPQYGTDSLNLINQLVGGWIWDSTICANQNTICYASLNYQVVFSRNSEIEAFEKGELVQKSVWRLKRSANGFDLLTEPAIENIDGTVFVSKNQVKFKQTNGIRNEYYFSKKF